jgi:hypothetical protein
MGQFKPMPKMKTTEPSVELKLKKGGTVKKADGGFMPMAAAPSERGVPRAARRGMAPAMPRRGIGMGGLPMGRKAGGEVESAKEHTAEMKAIRGLKSEVKAHEAKPASKAHKGLKTGGVIEKYATGGVIQKYKRGGKMDKKARGGSC